MEEDEDLDEEEEDEKRDDAAGVFSFSSPNLQARTLGGGNVAAQQQQRTGHPARGLTPGTTASRRKILPPSAAGGGVLSPSWTAKTLSRMSISGTSPDSRSAGLSSSPQSHLPHQQQQQHSGITGRGANLLLGTGYPSSSASASGTSASPGANGNSIFGPSSSATSNNRRRGSSARPYALSPSSAAGLFSSSIEEQQHSIHHSAAAGHPYARASSRELAASAASKSRSRSRNRTLLASSLDARQQQAPGAGQAATGFIAKHTDRSWADGL